MTVDLSSHQALPNVTADVNSGQCEFGVTTTAPSLEFWSATELNFSPMRVSLLHALYAHTGRMISNGMGQFIIETDRQTDRQGSHVKYRTGPMGGEICAFSSPV